MTAFKWEHLVQFSVGLLCIGVSFGIILSDCRTNAAQDRACKAHGEKAVHNQESYTLCEQDGGTVVRR